MSSLSPSMALLNSAVDFGNSLKGIEFPLSVLPKKLQQVVVDLYEYNAFPIEYTAASMVSLLGLAIGATYKVHLMKGWDDMAITNMALVGEPVCRINWAHSILKLEDFHLQQCLFGEHLLASEPDKQIAIVESEKTAIIASFYLPQYLWLATGGKGTCWHEEVLSVLRDRQVILFPDLKGTEDWRSKMRLLTKVGASPYLYEELERIATPEEHEAGLDIADFLLRINPAEGVWELMKKKHPALRILEEKLDLVLEGFAPA